MILKNRITEFFILNWITVFFFKDIFFFIYNTKKSDIIILLQITNNILFFIKTPFINKYQVHTSISMI